MLDRELTFAGNANNPKRLRSSSVDIVSDGIRHFRDDCFHFRKRNFSISLINHKRQQLSRQSQLIRLDIWMTKKSSLFSDCLAYCICLECGPQQWKTLFASWRQLSCKLIDFNLTNLPCGWHRVECVWHEPHTSKVSFPVCLFFCVKN